jgi:predicted O-linked N-acetylglucosamine transferase (SPINDLY family)
MDQAMQIAVQHHQAGRLQQAEQLYRQILAQQPEHPLAIHNLGLIAHQVGRNDVAVDLIRRAIALRPNYPEAHSNLGVALKDQGQLDEAIAAYRQAVALKPDYAEAYNNLGNALENKGQLDDAIAAFRQAIALKPDYAEAHSNLGNALVEKGQLDDAIAVYRRAIALKPGYTEAHSNLGNALVEKGQLDEAIAAYRQAIALTPNSPEARNNLGVALKDQGRLDEAIVAYRQAIALKPNYPEAHSNLGVALKDQGRLDEAIAAYRQAIALKPNYAEAHSNLIFVLHYDPAHDGAKIHEEHRLWNERHAKPLSKLIQPHTNVRDPTRRLKIGYVSPDFSAHPMSRFLMPVIEHHDRTKVEVYCYANVRRPDETTARFRELADAWRNIAGVSDEQVAEQVRQDQIDILLDLAMHTSGNRLLVFARKPAPVQVTWLACPGSTGMDAIDYRLTDRFLEPPGTSDSFSTETSIPLPDCWCCYRPLATAPPVSPLPAPDAGLVTFGCLNNFCKVSAQALTCWCAVMREIPASRLLLHASQGSHRQAARELLSREGVNPDRLSFVDRLPAEEYLRLYHQIDIALDPFPYSGGTTSCDALWMGVPVVSLSGAMAAGRQTATLLHNIGLSELLADSQERYIEIAKDLARDLPRLSQMRAGLRQRMQASPLMDEPRFTRNVEAAYREMWRQWCATTP